MTKKPIFRICIVDAFIVLTILSLTYMNLAPAIYSAKGTVVKEGVTINELPKIGPFPKMHNDYWSAQEWGLKILYSLGVGFVTGLVLFMIRLMLPERGKCYISWTASHSPQKEGKTLE